ncbi:MAG: DUF362 domain-containing protein [Planctomycetota bacterium]
MDYRVAIVKCAGYETAAVNPAVDRALDLLGLAPDFFRTDGRILLKPNLLSRREPDRAVTTHPAVIEAVIGAIRKRRPDARLAIGDSPGGALKRIASFWEKAGWQDASDRTGVPLISFDDTGSTTFPAAELPTLKSFTISKAALEPGLIVNLPKLKTHTLTYMTGAMKNLFGLIPGLQKAAIHKALPAAADFGRFIAVLNRSITPALHVVDAVVAMEGNGPASGKPVQLGLIIAGTNALAVDMVAAAIIGIRWNEVIHLAEAARMGNGPAAPEAITVVGETIAAVRPTRFKLPASYRLNRIFAGLFIRLCRPFIWVRPRVNAARCKRCNRCVESCPAKAMTMRAEDIAIDYKACISCMCCHELCEYNAVRLDFSFLARRMFSTRGYDTDGD